MLIEDDRDIERLVEIRCTARDKKQYEVADMLRDFLDEFYGVLIDDTSGATIWYWKNV